MKRTAFKPRAKPMSRGTSVLESALRYSTFKAAASITAAKKPRSRSPGLKSKQRAVTKEEKQLWNQLATVVGCIACRIDGRFNDHVSIHHIDGRTKPGCHRKVLPLCAPHHQQDDTDPLYRISVHGSRKTFEAMYGTQMELLARSLAILGVGQ